MVKYQGQHLDTVNKIGVNLNYCILSEVWVSTSYNFQDTFQHLPRVGEGNGKEYRKGVPKGRIMGLLNSRNRYQ